MKAFQESQRCFVRIRRRDIAYFKFILEAHDNLGVMSVVDKYEAVLRVSYAPGREEEMGEFLQGIALSIPLDEVPLS